MSVAETDILEAEMLPEPFVPPPFVPAEVDLRDFPFTPLFRAQLFSSEFHAQVTDAEWRAGVTLWLKSWDQVPAGSLPGDDVALCRLAELGRDLKTWRKIKAGALRGWTRCSDERLHHKVVAAGVLNAWEGKLKQRWRNECARLKKAWQRGEEKVNPPSFEEWRQTFTALPAEVASYQMTSFEMEGEADGDCPSGRPWGQSDMSRGTNENVPGDVPGDIGSKRKREGEGKREGKGQGQEKREGEKKRETIIPSVHTTETIRDTARATAPACPGVELQGAGGGEGNEGDLDEVRAEEKNCAAVKQDSASAAPGQPEPPAAPPAVSPTVSPTGTSAPQAAASRSQLLQTARSLRDRLEVELNLPIPIVTAPLLGWLQAGASPELIEATIADVLARRSGSTPVSISYFGPAILRAQAMAKAAAEAPAPAMLQHPPGISPSGTSPPPGATGAGASGAGSTWATTARFDPVAFIRSGAADQRHPPQRDSQ